MNIDIRMPTAPRPDGWAWARSTAAALADSRDDGPAVLAAVDYFESLLGRDWPGWKEGRPLANTFFTRANSETVAGVELHRVLALLEDEPDIGEVVGQLKSAPWEQFVAATMVVELASRARQAGIETKLLRARGKTIADLRLKLNDRWVTIECLALHETAVMRHADDVYIELERWLTEQGLDQLGRTTVAVLNERSPSEVLQRLPEVKHAVANMVRSGLSELALDGFAKITFERGLSPLPVPIAGLGGEPVETDIRRMRHRMREKSRQLEGEGPSLLVVRSRYLFVFDHLREEMLASTLRMLDAEIGHLKNISAAMVYETWLGSPPPLRTRRAGRLSTVEGTDHRGRSRVAAFVAGADATHPLSDSDVDAFVGPASFW
jgi:hypothetical protein